MPEKYKSAVIFEPQRLALRPNEEMKVSATFTPMKRKEYIVNVPIYAFNMYDHAKDVVGYYNPGSGVKSIANIGT